MPNALLTPQVITREALRVLHQKATFLGSINKQYDDRFAKSGAKIGSTLDIRLPNEYVVRTGATMVPQDTVESKISLNVTTQKGVDLNFTAVDLTMNLDDFSSRIIEPAMSVLAANIEADAMTMANDVYNTVNNIGQTLNMRQMLLAKKLLTDSLAPSGTRNLLMNTQDTVDAVDNLKGLFQDSTQVAKQYREGVLGTTAGFGDIMENTILGGTQTGTAASATGYTVTGAGQTGAALTVGAGTATFVKGDVFTIVGVNRVHPETKVNTGNLQTFVVTADYAGGAGSLQIAPAIATTGGRQNVTGSPVSGAALVKIGGANQVYRPSLAYHKDAFTFATADLVLPEGVDWKARETYDGISMRMVRQYNISNDTFPCRLDVLYGYKTLRAQLAARILSN